MQTVNRLTLPFKLDQLTEGLGNCFPIAIIQQLRRPEISTQLNRVTTQITKQKTGPTLLRHCVKQFIKTSEHENVANFKQYYEETEGNRESWTEYWKRMTGNKVWVDSWFVQATAWYLKLDLWIVDCANRYLYFCYENYTCMQYNWDSLNVLNYQTGSTSMIIKPLLTYLRTYIRKFCVLYSIVTF